jgi:hypothetical protein
MTPLLEETMNEKTTRLPPRDVLAKLALDQALRAYPGTIAKDESTVLSSAAHGGVTGFINGNFFPKESPKPFFYTSDIILREVLDQAYRVDPKPAQAA